MLPVDGSWAAWRGGGRGTWNSDLTCLNLAALAAMADSCTF
jgi:hypothetical protein